MEHDETALQARLVPGSDAAAIDRPWPWGDQTESLPKEAQDFTASEGPDGATPSKSENL